GFYENFPRMLPEGLGVNIDPSKWELPEIFQFLKEKANMTLEEMYGVFNMGIGMAFVVDEQDAEAIVSLLNDAAEQAMVIGEVIKVIGMVFVVEEQDAEAIGSLLNDAGEQGMVIGEVSNDEGVFFDGN